MKKPASEYLTATRQFFGDGEYWLMLPLVQMVEFEKRYDRSLARIYGELSSSLFEDADGKLKLLGDGDIRAPILNEILRLGLIGGNSGPDHGDGTEVGPQRADTLIKSYAYPERPVEEVAALVFRALHAAIVGDPAQREAMSEKAAQSDERRDKLGKQVGELFGPGARAREEAISAAMAE